MAAAENNKTFNERKESLLNCFIIRLHDKLICRLAHITEYVLYNCIGILYITNPFEYHTISNGGTSHKTPLKKKTNEM